MITENHPSLGETRDSQANSLLQIALGDVALNVSERLGNLLRNEFKKNINSVEFDSIIKNALPQLLKQSFVHQLLNSATETHKRRIALLHLLTTAEIKNFDEEWLSLDSPLSLGEASNEFLTTEEAAKLLSVSRTHLISLIDSGDLSASRTSGGHRRIPKVAALLYKEQMKNRQSKGLDAMMEASSDLGLYDDELDGIPQRTKQI